MRQGKEPEQEHEQWFAGFCLQKCEEIIGPEQYPAAREQAVRGRKKEEDASEHATGQGRKCRLYHAHAGVRGVLEEGLEPSRGLRPTGF